MSALKYPNKHKRKGYWKRYRLSDINNLTKVWNFVDDIINEIGIPFIISSVGRKPKLGYSVYAKCVILLAYFDLTLREMESLLRVLEKDSIDFSNLDRWFTKAEINWVLNATRLLHSWIERMFRRGCYIADSTKVTTTQYYVSTQIDNDGNRILELLTLKLHLLTTYFPSAGIISIANFHLTHGDANDNPILHEYLFEGISLRQGRMIHADKGYWSKENIRSSNERGLVPNIVPKEKCDRSLTLKKAIEMYDNEARKRNRGMIEGIFGGITTNQEMKTRFRLDHTRKLHMALMAFTHEIRTYFRAIARKAIALLLFRNNPGLLQDDFDFFAKDLLEVFEDGFADKDFARHLDLA